MIATTASAQSSDGYVKVPNVNNQILKTPYGLCVRTGYWSPAMAIEECDPDLVPKKAAPPAPPPRDVTPPPPPPPKPAALPPPPAPVSEKITMAADAHFDFDKSVLKPEGKAKLDDLVGKLKAVNLEVIIAIGHTDSIGSDAYNQKLSLRRAAAVKGYLVSKGIEANRIYTEGKGEKQPIADNKTKDGRAKNRRVEIEVVGTRKR
jgi:OmpA-OmpF porin, OOP family